MNTTVSSNNKRIAKNTVYLYVRLLVSLVIGLYTSRVILEVLGVEDYGVYNIVGGFVAMLSILTNTIRSAAQRFITYALGQGDPERLSNTLSTFVALYLIVAAIVLIIGEIVGNLFLDKILVLPATRIDAAFFVFHCSLIVFVINLIAIPYNACVIAHERMNFFAVISIVESVMKLSIALLLYKSTFDKLKTYAVLLSVLSLIILLSYFIYCRINFIEAKGRLCIKKPIFKEVFSYSAWVIIGSSSSVIKEQGVNIILNNFKGVAINAAKGVSMQVEHVVSMFASNIGTAISPQITKSYASGNVDRAIRLTFLMAKVQGILLIYLCLPLIVEAEYVLTLWLKEVPEHAVLFTKWVLILCVARTFNGSVVPLNLATGKVKYVQIAGGGIMLLNLPLSYLVLKLGADPVSTVIVGVIIEFIVMIVVSLFLRHNIGFPVLNFLVKSVVSILGIGIATMALLIFVRSLLPLGIVRFIIICIISTFVVSLLSCQLALNNNERKKVVEVIHNKIGLKR